MLPNLKKLMEQAQKMQEKMGTIQDKLGNMTIEGVAPAGSSAPKVRIKFSGKLEPLGVEITPEAVGGDAELAKIVAELVLMAMQDANKKASDVAEQEMSALTAGLNIPGLKLPF
jgi:hypothetical protein